ncbi:MAG: hypothetical protein E7515_02610 [Ruminococcaceae bacterium]|nr:hypothetical protein [Oscillospiraceae bacterium]
MDYTQKLEQIKILENNWQDAINQSEMYSLIMSHFYSPLPEGKKTKKAIVIGYDGCTGEMLNYLDNEERGAIKYLISNGGHGVFSYAGGAPYPKPITQETSTAPSWCSMLTGNLAENSRIFANGTTKEVDPKTLLIKLVEDRAVKSSAFYVSWEGHFSEDGATYLKEKEYAEEKNLKCVFACAKDDDGTRQNVLDDINSEDCSDFTFCILEYTDHFGHEADYIPESEKYMQAFLSAEQTGMDIVDAIKGRKTFDEEDWLVLITSDHGGYQCGHGGPTLQERITYIISNKEIVTQLNTLKKLSFMDNTLETALPQTVVYNILEKHFKAPLPEGKKKKKAIVLGYDGMRTDMLLHFDEFDRGAAKKILSEGGHAIFTYAGGTPYPEPIAHETDTGPGWGAMLTGLQSKESTIYYNNAVKAVEPRSSVLAFVEDKLVDKTAFYVSWGGHFTEEESTYRAEKEYAEEKGIKAVYLRANNDDGTLENALKDVSDPDCSDYIFTIFEYPDCLGHGHGFAPGVEQYMESLRLSEKAGIALVDAIEARPTYNEEDWLILVTPDHGGIGRAHGGPSLEERVTFIVSNKELL